MERNRDKVLLEQALARERAVEEFETAERNARRREIVELQQHYNKVIKLPTNVISTSLLSKRTKSSGMQENRSGDVKTRPESIY